jgi:hypothetical protein
MEKIKKIQYVLSALIIMTFLLIPLNSIAQSGKTNFSGTWAFNAEKSNMGTPPAGGQGGGQGGGQRGGQRSGQRGGFGGGNFVVKQDANSLAIDRTRGEQTVTTKYTLDGKQSVNTTGRGESKSVATWSADGKSLTIKTTMTFDINGTTRTTNTTEVWTLTSPSTLSIKTTRTTQNGDRVTTMVYDKK